jgi:hypothetical protein
VEEEEGRIGKRRLISFGLGFGLLILIALDLNM